MKTLLDIRLRRLATLAGPAATGLACSTLLLGCALPPATPELDARFGQATRNARLAQQLPVVAGSSAAAATPSSAASGVAHATGLDGVAAVHAVKGYRDTFRNAPAREAASSWVAGSAAP